MKLTAEQQAIINHTRNSYDNIAVQALAGTGKTSTIVEICKVIDNDESILAVAFNKSIADELSERLPKHARSQTINSLGHRAWQRSIGVRRMNVDKDKLGKIIREYCKTNTELWDVWKTMGDIVRKAKNNGLVPAGAPGKYKALVNDNESEWAAYITDTGLDIRPFGTVQNAIRLFEEILMYSINMAMNGDIDFDDQVYMSTCWDVSVERFDNILVDEAQDLSPLQHAFIDKMIDDSSRLFIVGDERQAIYAFRGATATSLRQLIEKYDCVEFPLTTCFRCPKDVIRKAQKYVPEIRSAEGANEGEVESLLDWSPETIEPKSVILCRNIAPLVRATYRLIGNGRPAIMLGRDIGKTLSNIIKRVTQGDTLPIGLFTEALEAWRDMEIDIARAKGKYDMEESVRDKYEAINAVQKYTMAKNTDDLIQGVEKIFADKADDRILLSTIHRAKGHEWPTVYFMDEWRIPSKYAKEEAAKNPDSIQLQQEYNLAYVAITRSKNKLFYIDSNKFKGVEVDDEEEETDFLVPERDRGAA